VNFSKTSCDAASATDSSEHSTRGKAVAFAIGSVAAGVVALSVPFVLPALRKFCLPYVPATPIQINAVVSLLRGRTGSAVDLGSGDGRVVVAAAKAGVYSVGYELNPWLVLYSKFNALVNGVYHHTEFHVKDLFKVNLQPFDTVIVFGVEEMMDSLREKLEVELSSSSQVIACRFPISKWTAHAKYGHGPHSVWQYHMSNCKQLF
jgi:hypothetical protein